MPAIKTLSPGGLTFIRQNEQCSLVKYPDPKGQTERYSIGYGNLWRPGDPETITPLQAMTKLLASLGTYIACVNQHVQVELTQPQFDSLVDFVFNEGCGALIESTLLKYLNAGNYGMAADEFLRWNKDQFGFNEGLEERRKKEQAMFLLQLPEEPAA